MPAKPKLKNQLTMGFGPTPEDLKLVAELKQHLEPKMGPVTIASLIRMGLRKLAESEGLR